MLPLGFVTDLKPDSSSRSDTVVTGKVTYLGSITDPLASSPLFKREVTLEGDPKIPSLTVQYYLPPHRELPVKVGGTYTFIIRRRRVGMGSRTAAWIIKRPTSGLPPLLMVAEPATYGQALDSGDKLIAPLRVERIRQTGCPSVGRGCSQKTTDRLRFSASTGAGNNSVEVAQAEAATLSIFGKSYSVIDVASWHLVQPCPDAQASRAAYLVVIDKP